MRLAYIDIGYNAIRAVVYEDNKLGSVAIFSEKFKSDILALLASNNLEIKHQTYFIIQYFAHIFKRLGVAKIKCVATAVLRGHSRALDFQKIIKEKFDIEIEILSGEQEAYLTAQGLISGINNVKGVAADLGGGSLELALISNKKVENTKSLALGTKLIQKQNISNAKVISQIIREEFGNKQSANLYFIGGALRLIGRLYMETTGYPLKSLHNVSIPIASFAAYLEKLKSTHTLKQLYYYKRIDYYAVLVAKALIDVFKPTKIIISNYGLKEGLRFVALAPQQQTKDIVYERIKELLRINENSYQLEKYYEQIYKLLIAADSEIKQIINYVMLLSRIDKGMDKTLKANFAIEFVLGCDIPFTHYQRLMVGLSLATMYSSKFDMFINKMAKRLLNKNDYYNGKIIGNVIKIARIIDGPEFSVPSFTLELQDPYIQIITAEQLPNQTFEKVFERLKNIAYARKMIKYT